MLELAETACYLGASLSASIARRIYGMRDKTFINKMFLWYFVLDAIMGALNTYLLFGLKRSGSNKVRCIKLFVFIFTVMRMRKLNRKNVHSI